MSNLNEKILKLRKGCFGKIASYSFFENDKGQRIFTFMRPFGRAYLVDSEDMEIKLMKKLIIYYRFAIPISLILTVLIMSNMESMRQGMQGGIFFYGYVILIGFVSAVGYWLFFGNDIKKLPLVGKRLTLKEFCSQTATKFSTTHLSFGVLGSLFFVGISVKILKEGGLLVPFSVASILLFSFTALMWGCSLFIKIKK